MDREIFAPPDGRQLSAAQRLSDLAELEMMEIRESMARVNASLAEFRRVYLHRPQSLRSLASIIRKESCLQERCASQTSEIVSKMESLRSRLLLDQGRHERIHLALSLKVRMHDLESGLESRRAAMSAAQAAPKLWMKNCRKHHQKKRESRIHRASVLWKIFAWLGAILFLVAIVSPPSSAFFLTLSSGVLMLVSALLTTVQGHSSISSPHHHLH